MADTRTARSLVAAETCLGMGVFADGILFHQLLQLRGMVSARVDRRATGCGSSISHNPKLMLNSPRKVANGSPQNPV